MNHQNKKTHPTGFKSPSKVSLIRSKSTDHLTSAHKSINRKNVVQKPGSNDVSATKATNLSKTKSTKSLKAKPKSLVKSSQTKSAKKLKPKVKKNSESDTKTIKKGKKLIFKQENEEQSFASSQQSFNPIQPLEYFFYHNTYIPIQNSAQRRFVFRIREIDQRIESKTADSFFINNRKKVQSIDMQTDQMEESEEVKEPQIKVQLKDNCVETIKPQISQFGTSMTPRTNDAICIQTQAVRFAEDTTKCFSTTLNDLQFLFLPEESNFQNFSRAERLHYKQLFESIAIKIWTQGQNLEELTPERVQILLYQRECIQMGMLEYYPQEGFPTHIFAIMSYLTNLFAFVEMNERSQTLQRLHGIYGFGYQQRLNRVTKGVTTKKRCSPIMSQQMFMSLENELFKQHTFPSQLIEQSVHIHNRAIFDAANQELEKFKPFFFSRGEPFPWSVNVGMTFFSIDEETLPLLFKQIKQKVLMKFGALCGLLVDYDQFKQLPNKEKHPVHVKKLQQHETKMINEQVTQEKYEPQIEQAETLLRVDLSKWVLASLIDEICDELSAIQK